MKYGSLTMGQVEAVVNKLGGLDGVQALLSDRLITIAGPLHFATKVSLPNSPVKYIGDFAPKSAVMLDCEFSSWVESFPDDFHSFDTEIAYVTLTRAASFRALKNTLKWHHWFSSPHVVRTIYLLVRACHMQDLVLDNKENIFMLSGERTARVRYNEMQKCLHVNISNDDHLSKGSRVFFLSPR